jgi:hypothetical protein
MVKQFTSSSNLEEDPANRFPRGRAFFVPEVIAVPGTKRGTTWEKTSAGQHGMPRNALCFRIPLRAEI